MIQVYIKHEQKFKNKLDEWDISTNTMNTLYVNN